MSSIKEEIRNSVFSAVSCGDLKKVEELVGRHGISYSPDFCGGYELLFKASFFGYKKVVKYLLEKGASVNTGTNYADTPLHFAAWFGDSELAQLLLDHETHIDAKDEQYETPLHVACQRGHETLVELLLDRGANSNMSREGPATYLEKFAHVKIGKVAFAAACQVGHEGFKEVLNFGAQIDSSSDQKPRHCSSKNYCPKNVVTDSASNVTPLRIASGLGHLKIVKLLLSKGAFVNAQTDKHSTPLLLAVKHGHTHVAKILLEHGACIRTKDDKKNSPLFLALEARNWHLVSSILQLKPKIDAEIRKLVLDIITHDEYTWNIIIDDFIDYGFFSNPKVAPYSSLSQAAIGHGYTNLVRYLLKDCKSLGIADRGFAPLHLAIESGHRDIIVLLLDLGCKINAKDKSGKTPLSYSLNSNQKSKHAELIQLLLNRGADLKMAPGLLHKAVSQMNVDVCKLLLENGACISALDENSQTPLHYASVLLNSERNTNLRESSESSTLYFTKSWNRKCAEIIQLLFDFGVDIKDVPYLLHEAVSEQNFEVCEILVKNGASVDALNENGRTPLHIAAAKSDNVSKYSKAERDYFPAWNKGRSHLDSPRRERSLRANSRLMDGASQQKTTEKESEFHPCKEAIAFDYEVASTACRGTVSEKCHTFDLSDTGVKKKITKFLLDNGADWAIKAHGGLTALHFASMDKKEDIVCILLDYKANVDPRANDGSTPLHEACNRGSAGIVRALLNNNANIEAVTRHGFTPLHLAVREGHLDVVKMLLNSNADVNALGRSNVTALHHAVMNENSEIISVLLDNGCDVNAENAKGKTALSMIHSVGVNIGVTITTIKTEGPLKHLIKLNVASLYVSEQNLQLLDRYSAREPIQLFKRKCSEEANQLKNEWKDGYKLLRVFEDPEYCSPAKRKSLICKIGVSKIGKYPIYESLLRYNFKECQVQLEMIIAGRKWLSFLLLTRNALSTKKLPTLPTEILEEVISYLTKSDLNKLICCGKKLKSQLSE